MKKRYIYILLMALVGLGFTTACNEKEFYDYEKSEELNADEVPYTLNFAVKMNGEDLARIESVEGVLTGIQVYTPPTTPTTRAEAKFDFTKGTDGFTASVLVMGVDRKDKQKLTITLKHTNGDVTTKETDLTERLTNLNHETADKPISLEDVEDLDITLPGSTDGGGSLGNWGESAEEGGEAGKEINE